MNDYRKEVEQAKERWADEWERPEPISRIDLQELEDRFGKYVRFVVEDMMNGKGERWKNESDR